MTIFGLISAEKSMLELREISHFIFLPFPFSIVDHDLGAADKSIIRAPALTCPMLAMIHPGVRG